MWILADAPVMNSEVIELDFNTIAPKTSRSQCVQFECTEHCCVRSRTACKRVGKSCYYYIAVADLLNIMVCVKAPYTNCVKLPNESLMVEFIACSSQLYTEQ